MKAAFASNSYKGNLHIGLATKNNNGSTKFNSRTVWVDIRATPTAPSRVSITGGTALKHVGGNKQYYIPNNSDTITFSWDGGGDPLGGSFTYRLHQIIDGKATYLTEVSSSTKSYSVVLPKQSGKHTLAFGVHVYTSYGTDNFLDSSPVDIHYYNAPSVNISSITRTALEATVQLAVKVDSSIPDLYISGQWTCYGSNPSQQIRGNLKSTQDVQTISLNPLFDEGAHTLDISFQDSSSLSQVDSTSIKIPANKSVMFVNKYGLGVGGAKADSKNALNVEGLANANSFASTGYEIENTGGDKVGWWSKVASFKVHWQYSDAQAIIKFLDHASGRQAPIKGELTVRVKQQNPMGQEPTCSLYLSDFLTITENDFKLIEITRNSELTDYEL